MPWEGGGGSVLDRIVALRSAVRTIGGVFGGAEAIPVVETTTRSLRNVPKGKELVHQTAEKRGKNPENQEFRPRSNPGEGATRKMSPHFKGARGVLAAPAAAGRPRGVPGFGLRRRLPPGAFPVPPGREMRAP